MTVLQTSTAGYLLFFEPTMHLELTVVSQAGGQHRVSFFHGVLLLPLQPSSQEQGKLPYMMHIVSLC